PSSKIYETLSLLDQFRNAALLLPEETLPPAATRAILANARHREYRFAAVNLLAHMSKHGAQAEVVAAAREEKEPARLAATLALWRAGVQFRHEDVLEALRAELPLDVRMTYLI